MCLVSCLLLLLLLLLLLPWRIARSSLFVRGRCAFVGVITEKWSCF